MPRTTRRSSGITSTSLRSISCTRPSPSSRSAPYSRPARPTWSSSEGAWRPTSSRRSPGQEHRAGADRGLPERHRARRPPVPGRRQGRGRGRRRPGVPLRRGAQLLRLLSPQVRRQAPPAPRGHLPRRRTRRGNLRGGGGGRGGRGGPRGAARAQAARGRPHESPRALRLRPHQVRPRGQARAGHRPRGRDRAHRPGPLPPLKEQSHPRRRRRRRQDRHNRGPRPANRRRGRAAPPARLHDLRPRHGSPPRRHQIPRRLRGEGQEGSRRAPEEGQVHTLHRRDPHDRGRRSGIRRLPRRLEPPQARPHLGQASLHRLYDLRRVQQVLREGQGPLAALPEDRHRRAHPGRDRRDTQGPALQVRGVPQGPLLRRGHRAGRPPLGPVHHRAAPPRQGHRRDRRGRGLGQDQRLQDGDRRRPAGERRRQRRRDHRDLDPRHQPQGNRGRRRQDRPYPRALGIHLREGQAGLPRGRPQGPGLRPGPGHRGHRQGGQALQGRLPRPRQARGQLPLRRSHGRGQDRARPPALSAHGHLPAPLRHVRVPGKAHRIPADRLAPRLRRLRGGGPPHRRDPQDAPRRSPPRRDREGPPRRLQHPPVDHGLRHPHR